MIVERIEENRYRVVAGKLRLAPIRSLHHLVALQYSGDDTVGIAVVREHPDVERRLIEQDAHLRAFGGGRAF